MPSTEDDRPCRIMPLDNVGASELSDNEEQSGEADDIFQFSLEQASQRSQLKQIINKIQHKFNHLFLVEKDIEQMKWQHAAGAGFIIEAIEVKIEEKNLIMQELVKVVKDAMLLLGTQETARVPFSHIVKLLSQCIHEMDNGAQNFRVHNFGNEVAKVFKSSIQNEELIFEIKSKQYFKENLIEFAKLWTKQSLNKDAALRYGLSCRGSNHFQENSNIGNQMLGLAKQLIECMLKDDPDINNIKKNLKTSGVVVFLAYGSIGGRKCFSGIQQEQVPGYGYADFFFCDIVRYILVSAGIPCYSDLLLQDYFGNDILPEGLISQEDPRFINIFTSWCEKAASSSSHMVMFGSPIYGDKTRNEDAVCKKEWQAFNKEKEITEDIISLVLISTTKIDQDNEIVDYNAPDLLRKCFPEEVSHLAQPQYVVDYRHSTNDTSAETDAETHLYKQKFKTVVHFAFDLIDKLTKNNESFSYYNRSNNWRKLFDQLKALNMNGNPELSQPDQLTKDSNVASSSSAVLFRSTDVIKDFERQPISGDNEVEISQEQANKLSSPRARNRP